VKALFPTRFTSRSVGRTAALIAIAGFLCGCASSTPLVNMWQDPDRPAEPMHSMLVIAVKKDPARRRLMEDAFAKALAQQGVTATASYRPFPDGVPDTAQVRATVASQGYDGVLVASRLDPQTQETYVRGYTSMEPRTTFHKWTGYQTYYVQVTHPGYVETEEVVRHQVDIWSTQGDGRMIWTAVGESIDPSSSSEVYREISAKIVPELVRVGIVPSGRAAAE
jgi:hypothetical protein